MKRILPIIGKIRQLRQRCRRTKSMTSPMFMRSSVVIAGAAAFSSSRLRCGDPEALLSPNKFNRSQVYRKKFLFKIILHLWTNFVCVYESWLPVGNLAFNNITLSVLEC
nr:ring-h2 finger protein atl65 [Quercus suber]